MTVDATELLKVQMVETEKVQPYEFNNRKHDRRQVERIARSIEEFGFNQPIVLDESGVLIVGEGRWLAARHLGLTHVPAVIKGGLSDEDKRAYRIVDNKLQNDSKWFFDNLRLEIGYLEDCGYDVKQFGLEEINLDFNLDEEPKEEPAAEGDDGEDEEAFTGIYAFREDATFPSTNKWGMPDLRTDMLGDYVPEKMWAMTAPQPDDPHTHIFLYKRYKKGTNVQGGTLAFYLEDSMFEDVWDEAVSVLETLKLQGWRQMVAPDFSLWRDDPLPIQMFNLYRNRWVARYWQEAGFKIIPSLSWSDPASYEWATAGMPKNAPLVSCQCRTTAGRKGKEYFLAGSAANIKELTPQAVMVYGGDEHRSWLEEKLPAGPKYHLLLNVMQLRRQWMAARKQQPKL